ncbi:hypothetical protein HGP17_21515 [Rhizobium sp. P38BS-XIX]|uniref:hypothetical protein n=1 Tax=Rhizobium sp. P38BS-XIX TaxID=2726740 RepID=UPI00145636DC|nr:hypothetical protein [Rhizobium sp. P38BS-XIX]NLR99408.1 hypothetical protein [Rhizobium sp. P38BS-XIX]
MEWPFRRAGRPYVGSVSGCYSGNDEKIRLCCVLPHHRNLLLTFDVKNGMNIPHMEFYGLFVPFFKMAAMGVAVD